VSWREAVRALAGVAGGGRSPDRDPGSPRDAPWVEQRPDGELTRAWLPRMRASGWVLPPSLARDDAVPSWTRLGVVDGRRTSTVDPRGLVTVHDSVSVDWAVGAEDRWYHPAREANVTQARIDGAPVVETTVRVPGGHVVHRAFGARGSHYPGGDEWLVVEVENRSAVPVVLAWVVRPFSPVGLVSNRGIDLLPVAGEPRSGTGVQVLEVYDPIALLPRAPSRWARTCDGTDPLRHVEAGDAEPWPMPPLQGEGAELSGEEDLALVSAAFLTPLPHTATARLLLLPSGYDLGGMLTDDDSGVRIGWPAHLPDAEAVARGWMALADRGPRLELPDPVLAEAVTAARRSLPLAHRVVREPAASDAAPPPATHAVTTGTLPGDDPVGDRMEILSTLAWWGEADAVDRLLAAWPDDQQRGGGFGSPEATAAALRALAVHAVASGDIGPARAWLPEVGGAIEALGRAVRKPSGTDPRVVAEGLDAGALLLARLDQPDAAARVAADAARVGARAHPTGPAPELDLDAPSTTPRALAATAVAAARAGQPSGALWGLLRRASATWTWSDPERWVGDDGLAPARLLDAVARLLVADGPEGPALTPWLPPAWWGQGWELHGAPTRWGTLSYAVRWHGDRPAVLWELADPPGEPGAVLTAPGLDPGWSSRDRRGEALLDPVPRPAEAGLHPDSASASDSGSSAEGDPAGTPRAVAVAAPPRSVWRPQDPGPDAPPPSTTPPPAEDPPPGAPDDGGGASFT